ncbi:MAG: serine hydrolase [Pseudomonadota bacterium]
MTRIALLAMALVGLAQGAGLVTAIPDAKADAMDGETKGLPIADALAEIDAIAADIMAQTGVPGMAVAVVHGGETVFARGYGVRERGKPGAVAPDTVFQIASLSKSLAATVVAHEVGAGRVAWTTPVKSLLPWFELSDPWVSGKVTIGDMFSHRSGLPDHAGDYLETIGFNRREILERLDAFPLAPFRVTYGYTNFGLTAAAEAVATAAGRDWESLSQAVLYEPLAMRRTSSRLADFLAHEDRAIGHVMMDGAFVPYRSREPDAQSPAGGASSTVEDFAKWMTMMLGEGRLGANVIVEKDALLPAMTAQMITRPAAAAGSLPGFYGFGIGVRAGADGNISISHSGAFILGAGTNYTLLPDEDVGIVTFVNAAPTGAAEALNQTFVDLVRYGAPQRDWGAFMKEQFVPLTAVVGTFANDPAPAGDAPAIAQLTAYVGTYGNALFGEARVSVEDGELTLSVGPAGQRFTLTYRGDHTFSMPVFTEFHPHGSTTAVTFQEPQDGLSPSVVVEFLNEHGLGTFAR